MNINQYLVLLFEYRWELLLLFVIIKYGRTIYVELLFNPLAGGNGKVQMDELAKGLMLVVCAFSAYAEGKREHEWHIFSDGYWFALLGAVCVIAGMKNGTIKNIFKSNEHKT